MCVAAPSTIGLNVAPPVYAVYDASGTQLVQRKFCEWCECQIGHMQDAWTEQYSYSAVAPGGACENGKSTCAETPGESAGRAAGAWRKSERAYHAAGAFLAKAQQRLDIQPGWPAGL